MKNIIWYINRFRAMSIPEIIHRAKKKILPSPKLKDIHFEIASSDIHFTQWDKEKEEIQIDKQIIEQYIKYAEKTINNRYDIFDLKDIHLPGGPDWQRDYSSDKKCPFIKSSKINYRDYKAIGNVKYIWELNRQQYLIPVSIAYYLTGDERYKEFVLKTIERWIDENPYNYGINWTSNLELALRITAWYFALSYIAARSTIIDAFLKKVCKSIYVHTHRIIHNPSLYSSANNHLIGEMAGVICAATFLNNVGDMQKWKAKALEMLKRETEKQVYPDGVGVEQAPSYQLHTVDYYLLSIFLLKESNLAIPNTFVDLIIRSAEFFASIMNINEEVPHIGDEDGSRAIQFHCSQHFNEYKSIINSAQILLGNIPKDFDLNNIDLKTYWLLIKNNKYASIQRKSKFDKKYEFPQGGYYIIGDNFEKQDEVKIVFDCGPLGFESLSAHGHCDALSLLASYKGSYFLIDQGTYKYYVDDKMRNYFRSTAAHSTIRIDGEEQSVMAGPFLWGYKAKSKLINYKASNDIDEINGEHYGYTRLKNPLIHQRELRYSKIDKTLTINDNLKTSAQHLAQIFFHFSRDGNVSLNNNECEIHFNGKKVTMILSERIDWRLLKGSNEPMAGWESKDFGDLKSCFTLIGTVTITSNESFKTIIKFL